MKIEIKPNGVTLFGNVVLSGNATFYKDLSILGNLYLSTEGFINNSKIATLQDISNATQSNYTFSTNVSINQLTVTNSNFSNIFGNGLFSFTSGINNFLLSTNGITIDSNLNVLRNTNFKSLVSISGPLNIQNNISLSGNLLVDGNITMSGSRTDINSILGVSGGVNITGNTLLNGNLTVSSSNVYINSLLGISGGIVLTGGITMVGSSVFINSQMSISGGISVTGDTLLNGNILVSGTNVTVNSLLGVSGGVGVSGDTFLNGNLTVSGSSVTINSLLGVSGGISVTGDTLLNGNLTLSGTNVTVNSLLGVSGGVGVTGDTILNGNLIVSGTNVTVNSLLSVSGGVRVTGDTLLNGNLTLSGTNVTVNSIVNVSGGIIVTGGILVTGSVTMSNVSINGNMLVSGSNVSINSRLIVSGGLIVTGSVTLNNGLSINGSLNLNSGLGVNGGLIITGNSTFNAINTNNILVNNVATLPVITNYLNIDGTSTNHNITFGSQIFIANMYSENSITINPNGFSNGNVLSIAFSGNQFFAGGDSAEGGNFLRLFNGTNWSDLIKNTGNRFPQGSIISLIYYSPKRWLFVGGSFPEFTGQGSQSSRNIAYYNFDIDNPWSGLVESFNGSVNVMKQIGTNILIGGNGASSVSPSIRSFAYVNTIPSEPDLISLDNNVPLGCSINAITTYNNNIYIGGNDNSGNILLRVNTNISSVTGNYNSIANLLNITGTINALDCDSKHNLYVGGNFSYFVAGITYNNLLKYNLVDNTWYPLVTGLSSSVNTITIDNNDNIYVGNLNGFYKYNELSKTVKIINSGNTRYSGINNQLYYTSNNSILYFNLGFRNINIPNLYEGGSRITRITFKNTGDNFQVAYNNSFNTLVSKSYGLNIQYE